MALCELLGHTSTAARILVAVSVLIIVGCATGLVSNIEDHSSDTEFSQRVPDAVEDSTDDAPAVCGDGVCESNESFRTCYEDCADTWRPTDDFVTTWKTDNEGGVTSTTSVEIPAGDDFEFFYDVDWNGDGTFDEFGLTGSATHDYGVAGTLIPSGEA
ncbi:MAG: hypothetical protein AAFU77_06710 [Myxococcota bacterium]